MTTLISTAQAPGSMTPSRWCLNCGISTAPSRWTGCLPPHQRSWHGWTRPAPSPDRARGYRSNPSWSAFGVAPKAQGNRQLRAWTSTPAPPRPLQTCGRVPQSISASSVSGPTQPRPLSTRLGTRSTPAAAPSYQAHPLRCCGAHATDPREPPAKVDTPPPPHSHSPGQTVSRQPSNAYSTRKKSAVSDSTVTAVLSPADARRQTMTNPDGRSS